AGKRQPLQQVNREQHYERDDLDRDELAGAMAAQPGVRGVAPIRYIVGKQRSPDDQEHRPLGRELDADRDQSGDGPHARFIEAEEPRGFAAQPVGRDLRGGLAVQVQAKRVPERPPATGRPHGELDAPRAHYAVDGEQRQGEEVAHSTGGGRGTGGRWWLSRSSRPTGRGTRSWDRDSCSPRASPGPRRRTAGRRDERAAAQARR